MKHKTPISTAAAALGSMGGKAGTGKNKRRGNAGYYARLARKSATVRRKHKPVDTSEKI